ILTCNGPRGAQPSRWTTLARKVLPPIINQTRITDVMTRQVTCVTPDVSVESLTALLFEANISGVPGVDEDGHPVGGISKTDLLRDRYEKGDSAEEEPLRIRSRGVEVELGPGFHAERIASATVGEVMTPVAFTLEETAPLSAAAALMATEGIHRL